MTLQNLAIVRFVNKRWEKHKNHIALKKRLEWQNAHEDLFNPFSYEYEYTIQLKDNGVVTAQVLRNGEPFCMYYSDTGFEPLANFEVGNWVIPEEEQELMLNDISSGPAINGLTILHDNPIPKSKPESKFANLFVALFFSIILFCELFVLPYLEF